MDNHLKMRRVLKTAQLFVVDAFSIFASFGLAVLLFRFLETTVDVQRFLSLIPMIIVVKIVFYYLSGLYKVMFSHVGFEDVFRIVIVAIISNVALFMLFMITEMGFIHPLSLLFITPLEIMFITLPRVARKLWRFITLSLYRNQSGFRGKRTLIVGAGDGGETVIKELYRKRTLDNIPVAFVDDDTDKLGKQLLGIPVVGTLDNIENIIQTYDVEEVIIAIANMKLKRLQSLVGTISEYDVKIKRLPIMQEIEEGATYEVMDVKVEDLLNRDEIELDTKGIAELIKGETVLVTGGGGSIGSELCRQIMRYSPKRLIIFDIYENNAYDIQMEIMPTLKHSRSRTKLDVLIGSVYNEARVREIFAEYKPTIVFHAAAYKHVPLMEDSPQEAIRTNILGTYYTAKAAQDYEVEDFVLVSSDKAVRPTNVMGATKRYAELIIQKLSEENGKTKFSAVRFGNVLGSNGSVIPLFQSQIEQGGPLTVTHPDVTRYFMTIPEAVSLILQSATYADGGEIFILDMGEPVKIKALAEKMIKLAGFKPYEDVDIEYIGMRPGEKMYEEFLLQDAENVVKTSNEKIWVEKRTQNGDHISFEDIEDFQKSLSGKAFLQKLSDAIRSYEHTV